MSGSSTMPVFFIAHGNPMNAIEHNPFTDDWHKLFADCPKPNGIVIFSAHWHVPGTRILYTEKPKTIHDFGGFPPALYQAQYPCPGDTKLAESIAYRLEKNGFQPHLDESWGLDHGSWSILRHLYPEADIPALQISLDNRINDFEHHRKLASTLKPMRDEGILFIASGNIVHNIMKWMMARPGDSIEWAKSFDTKISEAVKNWDLETLSKWYEQPYAKDAVPTIEHFLPLFYAIGLTGESEQQTHSSFAFDDLGAACSRSIRFDAAG